MTPEEIYEQVRKAYHDEHPGRGGWNHLNAPQRKDRIRGYKHIYPLDRSLLLADKYGAYPKVEIRLMGIVGIAYVHIIQTSDLPPLEEDEYWEFIDYLLDKRSDAVHVRGRADRTGRTNKSKKKTYR